MEKYTSKTENVVALKWTQANTGEFVDFITTEAPGEIYIITSGPILRLYRNNTYTCFRINQWAVKGEEGQLYPLSDSDFFEKFQLADEAKDVLALQVDELEGKYTIVSELLEKEKEEVARLTHVIDRDRYIVAAGIVAIETSLKARSWTLEGRGPYEWDDDDYRKEFGIWMTEVYNTTDILHRVSFDKTDCTTDPERIQAARNAAQEIIKQPIRHREMIAADLGLFDVRDAEIAKLKHQLFEVQTELAKYKPNYNNGFCNKCGYFGEVVDNGNHKRPDGSDCPYLIAKTIPVDKLTPEFINISIETIVMMCKALGSIDPNVLITTLQQRMKYELVIEVLQLGIERGKITYNLNGFIVAVN